ncbi:MAG: hypothetical protein RBR70_05305 [Arcobacter sp.]|jgi:hypothetical protein|uniref:rolling circle replication-associated protein n=1 Tax=Arcobacter sp. TaxID=1872629 RepID=UPI002A75D3D0|nr:hypothetical protein [Arcobacter sp.]MDY3204470.1 hypothetical protein [Arcobacter sp.]
MYGITKQIRAYTLKKIDFQKDFLSKNSFKVGADYIPMIELFKNAYINPDRYISEVNHRVYSLNDYAKNRNLKSLFGTITLPSEYHPTKLGRNGRRVSNPRYCNKNKIPMIERVFDIKTKKHVLTDLQKSYYSPKEGAKKLSRMFKALLDLRVLRNIPKEDKCYFRVYEPQEDGTPHIHFSLFVPGEQLEKVKLRFNQYFEDNFPKLQVDFQTNIDNPVAYLMKYILKTFDDLRQDDNNISDLSLWYLANKITRFYTSKTLISLEVYRRLNGRFQLLELTRMFKDREINYFVDTETNAVLEITDKHGSLYIKKPTSLILKDEQNDFKSQIQNKWCDLVLNGTQKERQKIHLPKLNQVPIFMNNKKHYMLNGQVVRQERLMTVNRLTDNQLLSYYYHLDSKFNELDNYSHFALVKNEMIKRGFLDSQLLNVNDVLGEYGF